MSVDNYTHSMPKVELHAHLSGSLSCKTIDELVTLHRKTFPDEVLPSEADKFKDITEENCSFDATYAIFRIAQRIVDHPAAVVLATTRVIEEFAADNVKFLELRSTPRDVPDKMTKVEYIEAVIDAIKGTQSRLSIMTKFLVSIDRRGTVADAENAVRLCLDLHSKHPSIVVGIDLSGDARINDARDFIPVLRRATESGLSVTVHIAEVPNKEEVMAFLATEWRPNRLGHATCIHPDFEGDATLWKTFASLKPPIPVEICLTSNLVFQSK
jgi:adenosine deaminase